MADEELPYGASYGRGIPHMRGIANSKEPPEENEEPPLGEESAESAVDSAAEEPDADDEEARFEATVRERRSARGWIEFGPPGE